jgi:hypothetical protein
VSASVLRGNIRQQTTDDDSGDDPSYEVSFHFPS